MQKERIVMLADAESYYCSVEKAANPQYAGRPLAVAGDPARRSGIILAACPIAKSFGVSTAERLGEALAKCPELIVVRPRMEHYIEVSRQISRIYRDFTDLVEVFSIDEQFLDITGCRDLREDPEATARLIQTRVKMQTGIRIRIGISSNKILAKMGTDIWAKKNESGIFTLPKSEIARYLWPQPVSKMFGVGSRMTSHFARLGMYIIGDVANTPLPRLKQLFRARFGRQADIQAEIMWRTSNGLDDSHVTPYTFNTPQKSIGHMTTLPRDYTEEREVETVLLELTEEVCRDARRRNQVGTGVSVSCMCSPYEAPTGFSRQSSLIDPSNHTNEVYEAVKRLFYCHWNGMPVRRIGVILSGLRDGGMDQLDFFNDRLRTFALEQATDHIKDRFGSTAIVRASSLLDSGQARERAGKIGGHTK